MHVSDILTVERTANDVPAGSKKRLLEKVSSLIAHSDPNLSEVEVFESLLSRERLGSTGVGRGVAIPHGRLAGVDRTVGAFVRLDEPVDYDAVDGQPVDLLFALLVPENSTEEHLQLLATLAEMFSDEELLKRLHEAESPDTLHELLSHWHSEPT
ncbi:MAG TPA: PTS IIA-like nitrogen regulatory protein PtsN [Gammaproteobacteria bacterium]|nr:PTS IIA-like nitrogen regulatory protein PtsN [Gammaproteobacteria bacterium]